MMAKNLLITGVLLVVGVVAFFAVNMTLNFFTKAAGNTDPREVKLKYNSDGRSAVISFVTEKPNIAMVEYGSSPNGLTSKFVEKSPVSMHSLELANMKPATTYYYHLKIGDKVYDNDGIPFTLKSKNAVVENVVSDTTPIASGDKCQNVDYNDDGVINMVDYSMCIKGDPKPTKIVAPINPIVAECAKSKEDYNKDGVVNSFDRIECLKNKQQ
jgi:hypothetical protein